MITHPFYRLAFALPQRLRWKLFREIGGHDKKWVQWIYDADNDYSLRPMRANNCVFVHIPKAAGIAVSDGLLGGKGGAHASVEDYLSVFGSTWYDQAYTFTVVRHPRSRLISAYDFLRQGGFNDGDKAFAEKHLTPFANLDELVLHGLDQDIIAQWPHFRPQIDFLTDPRNGKIGVDFIGRLESIDEDFQTIAKQIGIKADLKKKNARPKAAPDETLALSPASEERLRAFYKRDFDALGYE